MKILPYIYQLGDRICQRGMKQYKNKSFYRNFCQDILPGRGCAQQQVPHRADEAGRPHVQKIETDLDQQICLSLKTRQIDAAIERILEEGTYSPRHFLLLKDPFDFAPLTALLVFNTKNTCKVRVSVQDAFGWRYESELQTKHRIPVMCLRAGMKNNIVMEIIEDGEIAVQRKFYIRTAPLPEMLTGMVSVKKHTKKSAHPLTFVFGGDTKFPYAFDESGEIRYYMSERPKTYGILPLSKGRFLFLGKTICKPSFANPHSTLAREMDYLGRCFREYFIAEGIHHDGGEMSPGGNLLVATEHYVEDAVMEINRKTGEIIKKLPMQNILSSHPYFDHYDWAHVNTVSYVPDDNAILVCMRNLHSIVKIDWKTDELLWILCDTSFWAGTAYEKAVLKPKKGMQFSYQAHGAYFLPEKAFAGTDSGCRGPRSALKQLIVYDNHWHARRPVDTFDNDKMSHVRIYEIDEANMTVRLKKDFPCAKSKIRSNAIATENRVFSMSGFLNKEIDGHSGAVQEYNKKTGKLLNSYLTYNNFYRAYPFSADYCELSGPMEPAPCNEGIFITKQLLKACAFPDTAKAEPIPAPATEIRFTKKTQDRKTNKFDRIKDFRENPVQFDTLKDLSEIVIQFYGCILLIGCRDHLIQHVYLAGGKNCYHRDLSDTEQKCEALYGSFEYFIGIPVHDIAPDAYTIYVQCGDKLYTTDKKFTVSSC